MIIMDNNATNLSLFIIISYNYTTNESNNNQPHHVYLPKTYLIMCN